MIEIVGTGHILSQSVQEVKETIEDKKPGIIAIELDRNRFTALEERNWKLDFSDEDVTFRSILKEALRGGSFPVLLKGSLSLIQRDLGKRFGIHPGSDMLEAVQAAKKMGCKIALIDRDLNITLNHVICIPLKEKIRLFTKSSEDIGALNISFGSNIESILEEENIEKILKELSEGFPALYSALVDERDMYMASNLLKLQDRFPDMDIVAVVGAGHRRGIRYYLKNPKRIELRKLVELRAVSRLQILVLFILFFFAYILIKIKFRIRK